MSESFDTMIARALANCDKELFRQIIPLATTLRDFERLSAHAATFKCISEVEEAARRASILPCRFPEYFASDNANLIPCSISS